MSELPHLPDTASSKEIAAFGLKVCRPLFWHDGPSRWPKEVRGASCFVMRFQERLVGVTAAHVVNEFRAAAARTSTLVCQLYNISFDLETAIIDIDNDLDIATFAVSEDELTSSGAIAIDCGMRWPPPVPKPGSPIQLVGYPEIIRLVNEDLSGIYEAYGALTTVDHVTDRDLLVIYDPAQSPVQPLEDAVAGLPPPRFDMSGCSGGPAIAHGEVGGLHRWFPVGIIVAGSGDVGSDGVTKEFDMIRVRRIDRIRPDGTIDRTSSSGWLPGR
jgi:hypothetical protein